MYPRKTRHSLDPASSVDVKTKAWSVDAGAALVETNQFAPRTAWLGIFGS
jgi:hypothetical protein